MDCTLEPDLQDPVCHPGKLFGSHCICDGCDQSKYQNKEFWDKYNGFTK